MYKTKIWIFKIKTIFHKIQQRFENVCFVFVFLDSMDPKLVWNAYACGSLASWSSFHGKKNFLKNFKKKNFSLRKKMNCKGKNVFEYGFDCSRRYFSVPVALTKILGWIITILIPLLGIRQY